MSTAIISGWENILLIALAGGVGATLRYLISRSIVSWTGTSFPWGTFFVNILGCLICGLVWGLAESKGWLSERARIVILVGFLGAFTTFSSFAFETLALIRGHQWWLAGINVIAQNTLGVAAVLIGIALARSGA